MKQQYIFCDCGKKLKVAGKSILDKLVCPVCRSDVWITPGRLRDAETETAEIHATPQKESVRFSWQSLAATGLLIVLLAFLVGILCYRDSLRMMKWVSDLESSNLQERAYAAAALVKMGAEAVPHLSAALKDDDVELRRYAAELLGEIGPAARQAIPDLVAALKDQNREVRNCAAQALNKISAKAPATAVTSKNL